MKLSRLALSSAALALAATLAACGSGSFDSSTGGGAAPSFPTAPQIDGNNYLDAFGVTSIAFARTDLLLGATDTAFAAALALQGQPGAYACLRGGSIVLTRPGNNYRFEFAGCDDGQHLYETGALEATSLSAGDFSGRTQLAAGDFSLVNFGYYIAYPKDSAAETANGTVTVRRSAELSRTISGQFSVLRLGRADNYTDLSLGRSAPDANGNTRPALGLVRIQSPRFPVQPLEVGVTFTAVVARAPDGSYLEVSDASSGSSATYLMRLFRGAGDTAQQNKTWPANDPQIKAALERALQ